MRVLNLSQNDWANYSHDNMLSLRSAGIDCIAAKEHPHKFNYPEQAQVLDNGGIKELIREADIVQIMHSNHKMLRLCKDVGHQNIVVYHTGTNYRDDPAFYNNLFNPIVKASIIALGEFNRKGAYNQKYCSVAVDTFNLKPGRKPGDLVRIGHFPSNSEVKGSAKVLGVVKARYKHKDDFHFRMATDLVDRLEHLNRLRWCDVYIEMFAPKLRGKRYGSWGTTAVEAAALGKVVITNHSTKSFYEKEYNTQVPFITCETKKELYGAIDDVINMNKKELISLQKKHRSWTIENHSYRATGKRLKKILNEL